MFYLLDMLSVHAFVGIFMVCMGFLVKKYPNMIAGYQSIPKEQKDKVNLNKISSRLKITFILMGVFLMLAEPTLHWFDLNEYHSKLIPAIILVGTLSMFVHPYSSKS